MLDTSNVGIEIFEHLVFSCCTLDPVMSATQLLTDYVVPSLLALKKAFDFTDYKILVKT